MIFFTLAVKLDGDKDPHHRNHRYY